MKPLLLVGLGAGVAAIAGGLLDLRWLLAPAAVVLLLVIILLGWVRTDSEPRSPDS